MPLEDLVGTGKYVSDLNETWPLGTDLPSAGDDHLRGIKNVLKNTFPAATGALTRGVDSLNRGSVPINSVVLFYQAAAPLGWSRVAGITQTAMLRVVATTTAGGATGGTHDPVLNDKVATHTHTVAAVSTGAESAGHTHALSILSGTQTANHAHSGSTDSQGNHQHAVGSNNGTIVNFGTQGGNAAVDQGGATAHSSVAGAHTHNFSTSAENATHQHLVSGSTAGVSAAHFHTVPIHTTDGNAGALNWQPRYFDVIVCKRDT